MTSAVLYGTTSDNELRPVRVTDSGEFVTDGGGGGDWYANLYVGGSEGDPSISLLSSGAVTAVGPLSVTRFSTQAVLGSTFGETDYAIAAYSTGQFYFGVDTVGNINTHGQINTEVNIVAVGDVYCYKLHQADGFDLSKIGQALSTIHDVIESVDDLEGLKNLFHLLLDNLKSDPIPPPPPSPEPPPEPSE